VTHTARESVVFIIQPQFHTEKQLGPVTLILF